MEKYKQYVLLCIMACMTVLSLSAQQKTFTLSGVVYDENGETLPGVTIYLKERTGVGSISDIDGKFSIKAEYGDKIVFSFVGYETLEMLVLEESKILEIRMKLMSTQIEEVVITGLGATQRKISSVAAVSMLDTKEMQTPVTSVANLLGGKVAGIISMQISGEPGQNISEFWVRGISTFGASSGALILIDGLEGDINSIDPSDIESFSVLKDASATAVYGVRGANGVVLVTTKRGEEGKLKITGRANWSLSHLRRVPEYLRAYDYAMLANEAEIVRGRKPLYSAEDLVIIESKLDRDLFPDISWQDEVLNRNSIRQNYYVSANGGGNVAKYFVSLGGSHENAAYKYDKDNPYASNVGYNTYNYRTNLDIELTKTTKVFFGTDGFLSINNMPGVANTDYIWEAQSRLNPLYMPVIYSNGFYPGINNGNGSSPWVQINRTGKATKQNYSSKVTLALSQDLSFFLDGLRIRMQGSYDVGNYYDERRRLQVPLYIANERRVDGTLVMLPTVLKADPWFYHEKDQSRKYHFESTINYDKVFGMNQRVSGLVYYYLSDYKATKDFTGQQNITSIPVRYQGISSRLTYSYKDTYMIDLNFGLTGSENFQPGRQYGFFPSIALGWVPTSYQWVLDNMPWVSFFKIRGSYGSVGNDRLAGIGTGNNRFPYIAKARLSNLIGIYEMTGTREMLVETTPGADNLQWERSLKSDVGVEGRFLNDRIAFVVDFFSDQRNGIFQQRYQVPDYVGLIAKPFGNVGRMRSYGTDGNVSYIHEINKDISFTVRGNFTYSDNEVQNWEEEDPYTEYAYKNHAGFPHGSIRGYQSLGLFKNEEDIRQSANQTYWGKVEPGDIKYKDINGDGKIDPEDMVPLSRNTIPVFMYGFGGEFRYKRLTLGVLFRGTGKTDFYHVGQSVKTKTGTEYINGMGYIPFYAGEQGNVLTLANNPSNRWIPREYADAIGLDPSLAENPNARFPKLQYGKNENNSQLSDFWKGDARYLRLQEVTLSYNLSTKWLKRAKIASVDLQLIGTNLYVWDKVKTFDPEQAQFNGAMYPIPAVYSIQMYIHL